MRRSIECLCGSDNFSSDSESDGYYATSPKSISTTILPGDFHYNTTWPTHALEQIASFCPTYVNKLPPLGKSHKVDCCFMLADISGFTTLSSALCTQGKVGLDQLRLITNESFANFVRIIYSHGGEVVEFAGDALLCIFLPDSRESSLEKCSLRAIQCGVCITKCIMDGTQTHVAISNGQISMAFVGGYNRKQTYIMNGPFLDNVAACINLAAAKEIVVTANVYAVVQDSVVVESIGEGGDYYRITSCTPLRENMERFCRSPVFNLPGGCTQEDVESCVPAPAAEAIRCHALDGLAEIRNVTTLFLRLDSFSSADCEDVRELQPFFYAMQRCLDECGGFMRQFVVDDKGCVLIGLWGVPTATHAANCSKALRCAVMMKNEALFQQHLVSIGITTGSVYCGTVGTDYRRDYVAIGRSVNLAARLMSKANGRIIIDKNTHSKIPLDLSPHLVPTEEMRLKGIPRAKRYFSYTSSQTPPPYSADVREDYTLGIEGFARRRLNAVLDVVGTTGHVHTVSRSYSNPRDTIRQHVNSSEIYSRSSSVTTDGTFGRTQSQCSETVSRTQSHCGDVSPVHSLSNATDISRSNTSEASAPGNIRDLSQLADLAPRPSDISHSYSATSDASTVDLPICVSRPVRHAFGGEVCPPTEVFIIKGISGSGKTAILNHFIHRVKSVESHVHKAYQRDVVFVSLRSEDDATQWSAIRKIFYSLLAVMNDSNVQCEKANIVNVISLAFSGRKNAYISSTVFPILKSVLDLKWSWESDNQATIRRSCTQLFESTPAEVVGQLFFYMLSAGVAVLAVDDAHFMCRSSWEAMTHLCRMGSSAMLVLTVRINGTSATSLLSRSMDHQCSGENTALSGSAHSHDRSPSSTRSRSPANSLNDMAMGSFFENDEESLTCDSLLQLSHGSPAKMAHKGSASSLKTPARHSVEYSRFCSSVQTGCLHKLALRPLNQRIISNILQNEGFSNVSSHAVHAILSVSRGNPFLLWKIIDYCHESQHTDIDDIISSMADNSLIVTMLERVPHIARSILKTASIIGEEFHVTLLGEVIPDEVRPSMERVLQILENKGFLITLFDDVMAFSSDLMRKFAYDLVPPSDAKSLHASVAAAIVKLYNNSTSHSLSLAYHYVHSGHPSPHRETFHACCQAVNVCLAQREVESVLPFLDGAFKHYCGQSQLNDLMDLTTKAIRMTRSKLIDVKLSETSLESPLLKSLLDKLNEISAELRRKGGMW
eukprot:CAMPEP_0185034408 /NCGR_PEP_ID=MMETSP1103-20130426/24281_1 /TAXON_ID=36769 /ORGANISM="Paraphysomonas bandaiensis, Strain Caron Lab Isolate" /LENGTH=1227 /DNA_ID=CAMNT_0027571053 /DNA_START=145 /DNA_END=3825 /DNA_ORIENTATION=+